MIHFRTNMELLEGSDSFSLSRLWTTHDLDNVHKTHVTPATTLSTLNSRFTLCYEFKIPGSIFSPPPLRRQLLIFIPDLKCQRLN